jgi:hypothetical protein
MLLLGAQGPPWGSSNRHNANIVDEQRLCIFIVYAIVIDPEADPRLIANGYEFLRANLCERTIGGVLLPANHPGINEEANGKPNEIVAYLFQPCRA